MSESTNPKIVACQKLQELSGGQEIRGIKNSIAAIVFIFLTYRHNIELEPYIEDFYTLQVIYKYLDDLEEA